MKNLFLSALLLIIIAVYFTGCVTTDEKFEKDLAEFERR